MSITKKETEGVNHLVKILADDDGFEVIDPVWCLVSPFHALGEVTLCTGEYFGQGESADVLYETKRVARGGITCPECLKAIKSIKAIRL